MIGLKEQRIAYATMAAFAVAVAMATFASGCAKRQAQRAVQISLTGLAHGVVAADTLVADAWPTAAEGAREQVLDEREAAPEMTVEEGMARYEELLAVWNQTLQAMRGARSLLYAGQSAFDAWLASGELPEQWVAFCAGIGQAVEHLIGALEESPLEVPLSLRGAGAYAARACELAAPWVNIPLPSVAGASDKEESGE